MKKLFIALTALAITLTGMAQVTKTLNVTTAGTLSTLLTATEKTTVTNLTLTGNIDARDFKCMRDEMTVLGVIDIRNVSIASYSGTSGTSNSTSSTAYPANEIPTCAFWKYTIGPPSPDGAFGFQNITLTSINLPISLKSIGGNAFYNCRVLTALTIPALVDSISYGFLNFCTKLTTINVESGNQNYSSLGGVLFDKNQTTLIECPEGKIGSYIIPNSVTSIGNYSFHYCKALTSVQIPFSVTSIGTFAFSSCSGLTSVAIPSSVTSIGDDTFSSCSGLTIVTIPSSVKTIGNNAFMNCSSLTSISIPNSVTNIGPYTFFGCKSLTTMSIPNSVTNIEHEAFSGCTGLTAISIPNSVTTIGSSVFYGCTGLTTITIPNSVTTIGYYAFENCTGLKSIYVNSKPISTQLLGVNTTSCSLNVPYKTKTLYTAANYWNSFVNIVEAPTGFLVDVNNLNIYSNAGSSNVGISANVTWTAVSSDPSWLSVSPNTGNGNNTLTITAQANQNSTARTAIVTVSASGFPSQTITLTQGEGTKTIMVSAGGLSTALTSTELSTIKMLTLTGSIDARDFKTMRDDMPLLANVDLSGVSIVAYNGTAGTYNTTITEYPDNEIPTYAFFNQSTGKGKVSLISVVMPTNTNTIGNYAFQNCSGLSGTLSIPNSVTSIGRYSFYSCTGLTGKLTIPNSVTSINAYAFAYCSGFTSLTLSNNLSTIGTFAFNYCSGLTGVLNIPASVTSIGLAAFIRWKDLIIVDTNNLNYSSLDGVLFNKLKSTLILCPTNKSGGYSIPSSVTYLENYAFLRCQNLTSITIPVSVNSLGVQAFSYCYGLTSISIPNSVTNIGVWAFSSCTGLTSIYVNSKPLVIPSGVFDNVNKTTCTLYVPYKSKTLFESANYWMDFKNIVENSQGFLLGSDNVTLTASAGSSNISITANVSWYASSNQSWLTISPISDIGNNTIVLTAQANQSEISRIAKITISATGIDSQTITVLQIGLPKSLNIVAGGLFSVLSADQLAGINELTLTGTIDARDFKTMRDKMPLLTKIDLMGTNIVTYTGTEGTYNSNIITYPTNEIPSKGFYPKSNLKSIVLPLSISSIGESAFMYCNQINSIYISPSVNNIGSTAFDACSANINVDIANPYYSSVDGVLFNKYKTSLIQCPTTKIGSFSIPTSVQSIEEWAFENVGISSVSIPSSVISIKDGVFYNCITLNSIYTFSQTPIDLSTKSYVFNGVNKTTCTLYVPIGSKSLYQAAVQWKDFTNIIEFTTSTPSVIDNERIKVYPNPLRDYIMIEGVDAQTTISICDLSGRVLLQQKLNNGNSVSLHSLLRGQYILRLVNPNSVSNYKIIKQ
jgi:hypothetical protein